MLQRKWSPYTVRRDSNRELVHGGNKVSLNNYKYKRLYTEELYSPP